MVTAPERAGVAAGSRTVFAVGAAAVLALLLARNHRVFTGAVYERGDFAANSIITADAKHFELLVGNYSRLGFSHPGPAFFYVQAFGEWFFHDLLGVVPAPWNGQWLALLALNAVLVALSLAILHTWTGAWRATALSGSAALVFFAVQPPLLASAWMPHLYVAPFLLLLTAGASVAAGRVAHLPALALAAGLLVHGHAGFLFFVPVLVGAALFMAWRASALTQRVPWAATGAVVGVFLLPIAINLLLHWPGEFSRYFGYGGKQGLHGAGATAGFVLHFWAERTALAVVLFVGLFGGVAALARWQPAGPPRRFLGAGLAMAALATVLFAGYAVRGVDDLEQTYVGHFSRAVPLLLLMLLVAGVGARPVVLVLAVVVGALGIASRSPALASNPEHLPELPRVLTALSEHAAGRPVVVDVQQEAWPAFTSIVAYGDRVGQRICARDERWRFLVTREHICTADDVAQGRPVRLTTYLPVGSTAVAVVDGAYLY
ncbi:hypothetical protein GCM10023263_77060 [Phytohabitans rumicis]